MTWTYLTYLQYVQARILMFVAKFSRSKRELKRLVLFLHMRQVPEATGKKMA
jgi:hypothetical protein